MENSDGHFVAGEDLDQIRRNFYYGNGNLRKNNREVTGRKVIACSAYGCHRCTLSDCPFADFIRQYWRHPRSD